MTALDARNYLYNRFFGNGDFDCISEIDAIDQAIQALDKQIKQKPKYTKRGHVACPRCQKIIHSTPAYCDCGQALDWEGC